MSYTALVFFEDKTPKTQIEFRNAWGGAARIWSSLFDKYLKNPTNPHDNWLMDGGDKLWLLAKRLDIPVFERAVHSFTFDLAYVSKENFSRFATDLRAFDFRYPVKDGYCNHVLEWASKIEKSEADAVGVHCTSVARNPWFKYDEEKDETIPISLDGGFEVYDWLESLKEGQPA